jgi:hypothetical protein
MFPDICWYGHFSLLICGTRAQNLSAHFSYTVHIGPVIRTLMIILCVFQVLFFFAIVAQAQKFGELWFKYQNLSRVATLVSSQARLSYYTRRNIFFLSSRSRATCVDNNVIYFRGVSFKFIAFDPGKNVLLQQELHNQGVTLRNSETLCNIS